MTPSLSSSPRSLSVGIMLIGNELLSGKVEDLNASYLIKRLRELGATVERVVMVPDRFDDIEPELRALSERFDVVFTSGGVGPTHDDITLEAVARAFGRPLEQRSALLELVQGYFQEQLTDAHLRMTRVPENTELLWGEDQRWPVFYVKNVYILPGVPRLFRAKFEQIAERFRCGAFTLRSLYLNAEEGLIAAHLARAEERFDVQIGSYPRFEKGVPYRVRVTVESRDEAPVIEAISWLRDTISSDASLGAEVFVEVGEAL